VVAIGQAPLIDVALVVDNSGSEHGKLSIEQNALSHFTRGLLAARADDRIGMVRVSTAAKPLLDLTSDPAAIDGAIASLFISNGWTALWDGVWLGNELLSAAPRPVHPDSPCYAGAYRSVVVFTDGLENNSAGQLNQLGTHWNKTLGDLMNLRVDGMPTAIYTVGVGRGVDAAALQSLADRTGGRYMQIQAWDALINALETTATQLAALKPVCFVPASCDATEGRTTVTTRVGDQELTALGTFTLPR